MRLCSESGGGISSRIPSYTAGVPRNVRSNDKARSGSEGFRTMNAVKIEYMYFFVSIDSSCARIASQTLETQSTGRDD